MPLSSSTATRNGLHRPQSYMWDQLSSLVIGTCSLAYSNNFFIPVRLDALGTTFALTIWPLSNIFFTYSPCPSRKKITTTNGSLTTVTGIGDVKINLFFTLKISLHVPKLPRNLISIQKLTWDVRCNFIIVILYFKATTQEKWLDMLENRMGSTTSKHWVNRAFPRASFLPLLFRSLCHPIRRKFGFIFVELDIHHFDLLKSYFLLIQSLDVEHFHSEVYELTKHKCLSFQLVKEKIHFFLIHRDICKSSTYLNVSGIRWFISLIDDCTRVTWIFLLKHKSKVKTFLQCFAPWLRINLVSLSKDLGWIMLKTIPI